MQMLHLAQINLVTGMQSALLALPCTCRALELAIVIVLLVSVIAIVIFKYYRHLH
jgi:hypothetical protein